MTLSPESPPDTPFPKSIFPALLTTHNLMKNLCILFACLLFLVSCVTNPPVPAAPWVGVYRNACVPEAISMAQGLRGSGVQSRVLMFSTPTYSHAATVYLYPSGQNQLWVWDSYWKSTTVRAFWYEPKQIAQVWLQKCGRREQVLKAHFLETE